MPQIIVTAGSGGGGVDHGTVTLRERVNATDFESERFTANLLERLGWAVEDATAAERHPPRHDGPHRPRHDSPRPEPDVDPDYAWEPLRVS